MKKILVPTDFSEHASYALEVAAKIAKVQNASITVLHMIGLSEAVTTKDASQEYEEAKYFMNLAKKHFQVFLDKPYLNGIRVQQMVQNYKIFGELNNVAREQHIDLIVMGSHGASGFNEFVTGSNTEKVVRTSDVPVLVVKNRRPEFRIKRILFACDFKEESILAFKNVKAFAKDFSSKLELIYINTPYQNFMSHTEIEERISKFLFKAGEAQHDVTIYSDYSVAHGLTSASRKGGVDLIAIPTRGRKPLSHFLLGSRSIGEDLANHANLPVLTFKIN